MFARQSLGLELSHNGLRLAVLSGKKKSPKLNSFSEQLFPPETLHLSFRELNVINPARFVDTVRESYLKLLSPVTRVSVSLPDSVGRVMLLDLDTRFKNRQEGADIIRWKLKKNFPIDIESIHLDYQILRENETGEMVTLVSVISKMIVNQYEELLLESGLEPTVIDFTTFNLYRLFSERLEISGNSLFLSFFNGILSMTIFHEGILEFYRAKEIASDKFADERIFREINSSLLVYRNSHPGHVFNDVFCANCSDQTNNLSEVIAEAAGMEPIWLRAGDFVAGKSGLFCNGKTLQNLSPALGAAIRNL